MRKLSLVLALVCAFCAPAFSQSVTVAGTKVVDNTGALLASGQWCFGTDCLTVTNGAFSGTVTAATATVTITGSGLTYLTVPSVTIGGSYFSWDTYVVASNANIYGLGVPRIACTPGAIYSQTDGNQSKYECTYINGANEWNGLAVPGTPATVAVGTVDTLNAGAPATVVNVGTQTAAILNFGIPAGPAPVMQIGTTTTLTPGSTPTVSVTGNNPYSLNFGIPSSGSATAGGSNGQLQYNNNGQLAGASDSALGLVPASGGDFTGNVNTNGGLNGLPNSEYRTISNNSGQSGNYKLGYWWRYLHGVQAYEGGTSPSAGLDVIIANDSLWANDYDNTNFPASCSGAPNLSAPYYSQNMVAEQLRIYLQSRYGYGGTGLQPLIDVAQCPQVNPQLYTASPAAITTTGILGPQDDANGWYSLVQMASGQVITWNANNLPYQIIATYCAESSNSNPISVAVDGVSEGTACGTQTSSPTAVAPQGATVLPMTTHTATFTCVTGPCYMYGAEGRLAGNAGNMGVRVHNLSVGSAPSGYFSGHTEFEDLIGDGTGQPSAQLVIYAMGTNDAGQGVPLATYESNVESYIGHELAKNTCPGATGFTCPPTVVIYRPGMDSINSSSYFDWLVNTYAPSQNLMVIDQTNRWGKTYVAGNWMLGQDDIHFNDAGNLDEAHTILSALVDSAPAAPIDPVFGDNYLNPGFVGVTGPAYTAGISSLAPGLGFVGVPGIPDHAALTAWPTGQTSAGWIGFYRPDDSAKMQWGEDSSKDFCVHATLASGACASYDLFVNHSTGAVLTKHNTLDDGSGNQTIAGNSTVGGNLASASSSNTQAVTITQGGGGTLSCFTSNNYQCSPRYGVVIFTMNSTVTDVVDVSWPTAFTHTPVCSDEAYDNTTSSALSGWLQDLGGSSETAAKFSGSATSGDSITFSWICN